jgi:hypothetical protein
VNPAVSRLIPAEMARRNKIVPVRLENGILQIAIEDPKDFRALNEAHCSIHDTRVL